MQKLCKVKTEKQIKNTLAENGVCSHVSMAGAMFRHCGEVFVARPIGSGRWHLYDRKNRPLCSDWGCPWVWVSEWLDFDAAAEENDLTKILEEGYEK